MAAAARAGWRRTRRAGACTASSSDAARAWDADARDPGELYRGARLASALDWAADHEPELNATERAFLDDGRRASGRAQRRLRAVLAGVASLLVLAVIAGVVALDQRGNARARGDRGRRAAPRRPGARRRRPRPRRCCSPARAWRCDDSLQTRSNLLAALLKSPAAIGVLRGDGDGLVSLDLSPDGSTLAFIDNDGTLSFIDTRTRRRAARPRDGLRRLSPLRSARRPALQP